MKLEDAWAYVKSELRESGVPCSVPNCPACTPLKDGIRTIDSFMSELIGLGLEEATT